MPSRHVGLRCPPVTARVMIRRGHSVRVTFRRAVHAPPRASLLMPDPVTEYLDALQMERGASRHTLAAYRGDLADFSGFARTRARPLHEIAGEDVVAYMEGLRRRGLKPASVARRLAAVRGLYRHLLDGGGLTRDPTEHIDIPRSGRPLPKTLPRQAVVDLIESPDVATLAGIR